MTQTQTGGDGGGGVVALRFGGETIVSHNEQTNKTKHPFLFLGTGVFALSPNTNPRPTVLRLGRFYTVMATVPESIKPVGARGVLGDTLERDCFFSFSPSL
jgi:hypothetical protein